MNNEQFTMLLELLGKTGEAAETITILYLSIGFLETVLVPIIVGYIIYKIAKTAAAAITANCRGDLLGKRLYESTGGKYWMATEKDWIKIEDRLNKLLRRPIDD